MQRHRVWCQQQTKSTHFWKVVKSEASDHEGRTAGWFTLNSLQEMWSFPDKTFGNFGGSWQRTPYSHHLKHINIFRNECVGVYVYTCAELHWLPVRGWSGLRVRRELWKWLLPPAVAFHGPARHHQLCGLLLTDTFLHDDPQVGAVSMSFFTFGLVKLM